MKTDPEIAKVINKLIEIAITSKNAKDLKEQIRSVVEAPLKELKLYEQAEANIRLEMGNYKLRSNFQIVPIGIISREDYQQRTLDIASGKLKPKLHDPKLWFSSIEKLEEKLGGGKIVGLTTNKTEKE